MAVTPEAFAREVLRPVEKGASGKLCVGGAAWMARGFMLFIPECMFVSRFVSCGKLWMSTDRVFRVGLYSARSRSVNG